MPAKRAPVYLWMGTGAGKTTTALGVALRQLGHGHRVVVIQWMKGRKDIGEYKIARKLGPNYTVRQFGRKGWVDLLHPSEEDKKLAHRALLAARAAAKTKPHLLILDELGLAAAAKLVPIHDVLALLHDVPAGTAVYITGRRVPKELIDAADYVTEFTTIKQPARIRATKGIEY